MSQTVFNRPSSSDAATEGWVKSYAPSYSYVTSAISAANAAEATAIANEATRASTAEAALATSITNVTNTMSANNSSFATDHLNNHSGNTLNIADQTTCQVLNVATSNSIQAVNIGTGSGVTTINIGGPGDVLNFAGTKTTINTTDMDVEDKLITLNKGGPANTAFSTGLSFEEAGAEAGYIRTSADGSTIEAKAPRSATVIGLNQPLLTTSSPTFVAVNGNLNGNATSSTTCTTIPAIVGEATSNGVNNNVSLSNAAVVGKILTGLDTTNTANIIPSDSLLVAVGKASNQLNYSTSANNPSTLVKRDPSGNFTAGTITAALNGNASTCTTIPSLSGEVSNAGNALTLSNAAVIGKVLTGLNPASFSSIAATDSLLAAAGKTANMLNNATSSNTASALVLRDGSGNASFGDLAASSYTTTSSFTKSEVVAVPTTVGQYISFGGIAGISPNTVAVACEVMVTTNTAGFITSSVYKFGVYNNATGTNTWLRAVPISTVTTNSANAFDLDLLCDTASFNLRLRRTAGTASANAAVQMRFTANNGSLSSANWVSYRFTNTEASSIADYNDGRLALARTFYKPNAPGAYMGYNRSAGAGMTTFSNQQGAGTGGFEFVNYDSTNTVNPSSALLTISGAGHLSTLGNVVTNDVNFASMTSATALIRFEFVTLPTSTSTNNVTQFASLSTPNGALSVQLQTYVNAAGFPTAATYEFALSNNATSGTWQRLVPIASSNSVSATQAFEIDVYVSTTNITFRARRTVGSLAAGLIAFFRIVGLTSAITYSSPRTTTTDVTTIPDYNDQRLALTRGWNAPNGAGSFMGYNRSGSSGMTAFSNQKGANAGGFEWLSYDSSNNLLGSIMSLDSSGNLTLSGTVNGMSVTGTAAATASTLVARDTNADTAVRDLTARRIKNSGGTIVFDTSTGSNNIFIQGGNQTVTGGSNVVIGASAGTAMTGGSANSNVFVGSAAGQQSTSGGSNVFVGNGAASGNTTGNSKCAVGAASLALASTDTYTTALGISSGNGNGSTNYHTTGTQCTYLGAQTGTSGVYTNASAVGYGAIATADNSVQLGNSSVSQVNTTGQVNCAGVYSTGPISCAQLNTGRVNSTPLYASYRFTGTIVIKDSSYPAMSLYPYINSTYTLNPGMAALADYGDGWGKMNVVPTNGSFEVSFYAILQNNSGFDNSPFTGLIGYGTYNPPTPYAMVPCSNYETSADGTRVRIQCSTILGLNANDGISFPMLKGTTNVANSYVFVESGFNIKRLT